MVIYSIYPPEVVLETAEPFSRQFLTVELDGRTFVLEMVQGQARIVRLISANPSDYLRPEWQPGSSFKFSSYP